MDTSTELAVCNEAPPQVRTGWRLSVRTVNIYGLVTEIRQLPVRYDIPRKFAAEVLWFALVAVGLYAIWFDYYAKDEHSTISGIINRWIHADPVIALVFGMMLMLFLLLAAWAWKMRFRYALALMIFSFCMGHLFWSQPKPLFGQQKPAQTKPDGSHLP